MRISIVEQVNPEASPSAGILRPLENLMIGASCAVLARRRRPLSYVIAEWQRLVFGSSHPPVHWCSRSGQPSFRTIPDLLWDALARLHRWAFTDYARWPDAEFPDQFAGTCPVIIGHYAGA